MFFSLDRIPDITERFPEGFGGVDMTPGNYLGPSYDGYEPSYEEIRKEEKPVLFEVGDEMRVVGIYGGVTTYKVEEIDRDNKKILLSERWEDLDGTGTRPAKWHDLATDEYGSEKALEWVSKEFGEIWIWAKEYKYAS